ncbi:unnamed protein product, partial [Effrenium voratum]
AALGIKRGQGGEWNEIAQQRIETWLLTARRRTLQSNVPQLALEDKSGSPKRKKASKPGSTAVLLEEEVKRREAQAKNTELETKVADLEAENAKLK